MKAVAPFAVFLLLLAGAGCGSSTLATPPTATAPSVTETFSGTVPVLGTDFHNFTTTVQGEIDLALTAAGPPPTITMAVAIGTPSGGVCSAITSGNISASPTVYVAGTGPAGTYCISVTEIGNALQPIDYTVTVTHF
jgi:hypothetical protein